MRLLLDTHIALWAIADSRELPGAARDLIAEPGNEVFVSAASLWEIAIKHALKRKGRGAMNISAADAKRYFDAAGYDLIGVGADHVLAVEQLAPHHSDPFDRMLVAQAAAEGLCLLSHDRRLGAYGAVAMIV